MDFQRLAEADYVAGRTDIEQFEEDIAAVLRDEVPPRFSGKDGLVAQLNALFATADDEDRRMTDDEIGEAEWLLRAIEVICEEERAAEKFAEIKARRVERAHTPLLATPK